MTSLATTSSTTTTSSTKLSIVIPCLNEADTIVECVERAYSALADHGIDGEVIVVDNDSDDGSAELAISAGATLVHERRRGYGSAYLAGLAAANGDYILMADGDLTYDFDEVPRFLAELEDGADLVVGNRMKGIEPGAMPWHHRYIGNPVLSGLLNVIYDAGVADAHCGMRAVRRTVLPELELRSTGMEFASEMVIRAAKQHLDIREFPIEYHRRGGQSKLSSFSDGWRHLRFLLVHSPNHLFVLPGLVTVVIGALVQAVVFFHLGFLGRAWDIHALIAGSLLTIVGVQVMALGVCARAYGIYFMGEHDRWFERLRARYRLEHGLLLGGAFVFVGAVLVVQIAIKWIDHGFGALAQDNVAVVAATLLIVGIQVFFTSFLLSILGLRRMP
jgi:glycosyltransferase involved in cell wall biosynthesis